LKNKIKLSLVRIGVHASIAGGISRSLERSAQLKCNTVQIFTHSPRQWRKTGIRKTEVQRFSVLRQKNDINPVFVHASYLINLASHSPDIVRKSIDLLSYEMAIADLIGAEYVVLHTGSASGKDGKAARKKAAMALRESIDSRQGNTTIILENTAGQRGDITSSIQSLADIMDLCSCDRIAGICIDTCHAFASGYDITSVKGLNRLVNEISEYIGVDKLKLIHLNDSKKSLGSGVDRHEHIGRGSIGIDGFRNILSDRRITKVPIILETPKENDNDDRNNLETVFSLINKRMN
jgi:deoxyribonuclease-4